MCAPRDQRKSTNNHNDQTQLNALRQFLPSRHWRSPLWRKPSRSEEGGQELEGRVRQPFAQARNRKIDEGAQLQRQAVLHVINEMHGPRRRLEGIENDRQPAAPYMVLDLIGVRPDKTRSA